MTVAWILVWAAAILLLPGWVIWRLVGPRGLPQALQIAPVFALSLALTSLVGWSAYVIGLSFTGVKAVTVVLLVLAALGLPFALLNRPPAHPEPAGPPWTLWATLAIALAAGLSALYAGPWMSATADAFYHLAAVRSIVDHGTPLVEQVFFSTPVRAPDPTSGTWHLAVALVSNLSGQDPIPIWRVLTVALAPLVVLAFFTLALSVTRNAVAASIATALYVVLALSLDFRTVANPNQFGDALAWLSLAFALRFVDSGSWRELAVAVPIGFAASAVHGALGPFLLVALAGGAGAAVLVRSSSWKRFVAAAAIIGAATLPLLIVDGATLAASAPYAAEAVRSPLPFHIVHHPWAWVWPANWYDNPGTVLGTAFGVTLWRLWRAGEAGAGLVIAVMLAIPLAALTPIFAATYSGQYLLARVSFVLHPLAWIAWGWAIALAIGGLRTRLKVPAALVILVSLAAMVPAVYIGPLARWTFPASSQRSFASSRTTDLTVAWRDRLAAIDRLPASAVLLAEPRMGYELAGLTGREVVAVPLTHTPAQVEALDGPRRRADALDATQGRLDAASLAGVIEHYRVTDVIVDMDRTDPAAWSQLAGAQILTTVASGARWRLYRYDPSMLDSYLDLPMQQQNGPELTSSGIGPQLAVAGRAVFARIRWGQLVTGSARLTAEAVGSTDTFSRTVAVGGSSTETFALPIPTNTPAGQYRLSLVTGGATIPVGTFEVGDLYQAEDMGGVVAGDSSGWTIVDGSAYEGGLAAIATRLGSATNQSIPPVAAGSYCVAARVQDDGSNRANILDIEVGAANAQVSWSGSLAGTRWVQTAIALDGTGGRLGMRLVQRGQAAAIVDALEIDPMVEGTCKSD